MAYEQLRSSGYWRIYEFCVYVYDDIRQIYNRLMLAFGTSITEVSMYLQTYGTCETEECRHLAQEKILCVYICRHIAHVRLRIA